MSVARKIPVESYLCQSDSGNDYTVTKNLIRRADGDDDVPPQEFWECSCIGWTRHVPRKDCKHIRWVQEFGPLPIDPLLHSMRKVERKALRKEMAGAR